MKYQTTVKAGGANFRKVIEASSKEKAAQMAAGYYYNTIGTHTPIETIEVKED